MLPATLLDARQRPLRDLRISVTDRCNFRCSYCMPKSVFDNQYTYLPQAALLSFEEIERVARAAVALGVEKIRLTGGEPLLRKNLEALIARLALLHTANGKPLDLTLTTNASLLARKAQSLKDAGLRRLTVSLDALDDGIFRAMNDVDFPVADVLAGIAAAQQVGFESIKVNMVVKRGVNDGQIVPMARHFRGSGVVLRYIEYMDVGATNGWRMDEVVPSSEILRRLQAEFALQPLPAAASGETALRYGHLNAQGEWDPALGEIGTISSVSQAFCSSCNRARLSTDGRLFTCLFASSGTDLRAVLRPSPPSGASGTSGPSPHTPEQQTAGASPDDTALLSTLRQLWSLRQDRYSELRALGQADGATNNASSQNLGTVEQPLRRLDPPRKRIEMSYIGG